MASLTEGEDSSGELHYEWISAPRFTCTCSRKKMGAVIRSLPIPERMELVQRKEPIVVRCQFCNERYEIPISECIQIWNEKQ